MRALPQSENSSIKPSIDPLLLSCVCSKFDSCLVLHLLVFVPKIILFVGGLEAEEYKEIVHFIYLPFHEE